MEILCLVLLAFSMIAAPARCQSMDTLGFISIDCGIPPNQVYVDPITNITYVSDVGFIDTGVNKNISAAYVAGAKRYMLTARSFPDGTRNCYTISATAGSKYLVRAAFMYGNYDGLDTRPYLFQLHLGVNLWRTMNITNPDLFFRTEVITVAKTDYVSVCLVNIGTGTPFISGLELRPLKTIMYPAVNASRSLVLKWRYNLGPTDRYYRFPDDRHDRFWDPFNNGPDYWREINTTETVNNLYEDYFEAPSIVMQSAVTPAVNFTKLMLWWDYDAGDINEYYSILHFTEIVKLTGNMSRQFYIKLNDALFFGQPYSPSYLLTDAIYGINPIGMRYLQYNISLEALGNSTLPPILNAIEIYTTMRNDTVPSDNEDVGAMMAIKAWYQIKRNWNGDPCSPKAFAWDGLNCTYAISSPARVTTLNLTSSGLTGQITGSFGNLAAIQYLDLSHNNLTGPIPDSIAGLAALEVLDLSDNQLSGSVPSALLAKSSSKSITLRIEGNPNLCKDGSTCHPSSKISTAVIVSICVVAVVLLLVLLFIIYRVIKRLQGNGVTVKPRDDLQLENRHFTYLEIQTMTNNFERELGQGGFGKVYYGCLENGTEVAVKMSNNSSSQGNKQFLAEAQHLTRVHHKNLVSLVGYCKDGEYLGLVYEFMSRGTLEAQLRGKTHTAELLSWRQRLRIAIESAQGLEYLHTACKPPLVHRDVKTTNILLSEKLEAKIADFGLSKAFQNDATTRVSTAVMGTPGYIDPEYYISYQLSEKSDVYSFGVVLLELITGKPAVLPGNNSLVLWVSRRLATGNIEDVIDARMQGKYDINSVWKCAEVALKCASQSSGQSQRPTMSDVVKQLKESLELETVNNLFTGNDEISLYSEETGTSYDNSNIEIEHVARMSVAGGPWTR